MRVFVLEDDPMRLAWFWSHFQGTELTCCTDAADAVRAFRDGRWDVVSLDHDLGGQTFVDSADKNTGAEFLRQCGAEVAACPVVAVHSYNQAGAARMIALLQDYGKSIEWTPFRSASHLEALMGVK